MTPESRRELLGVMARIEQFAAEAEALTVKVPDDETLLTASSLLAEDRRLRADVEWKVRPDDQE